MLLKCSLLLRFGVGFAAFRTDFDANSRPKGFAERIRGRMEFALQPAPEASSNVEKPLAAKTDVYPSSSSISTMLFDDPSSLLAHPAASAT